MKRLALFFPLTLVRRFFFFTGFPVSGHTGKEKERYIPFLFFDSSPSREKKTNEKLHPLVRYRDFDRAISLGENGI